MIIHKIKYIIKSITNKYVNNLLMFKNYRIIYIYNSDYHVL